VSEEFAADAILPESSLIAEAAPVGTFYSLRYPGSKRYFLGLILSMVGTWMQSTALAWLVLHELRSTGKVLATVQVFQFFPMLVLGAWAGSLADKMDKRRLMLVSQVALGLAALVLAGLTLNHSITVRLVYLLSGLSGLASAFDTPVRRAMIGDLVPKDALPNAMSLNTSVMTSSRVIGAALGGFVTKFFGTGWCFLLNGLSYVFMIVAVTGLRSRQHAIIATKSEGGVVQGFAHVWNTPKLRISMLCTLIVATFLFNYGVTFPLMIEKVFKRDSDVLGVMLAVAGGGSFVGAIISAKRRKPSLDLFLMASFGMGAAGLAVGWSPNVWLASVAAFALGLFGGLLMSQLSGLLIALSPPSMRGRVLALQSVVFLGSTPIGSPIIGAVSDRFGPRWGVLVGGYATIAAAGLALAMRQSAQRNEL
jgi:MFS family permease